MQVWNCTTPGQPSPVWCTLLLDQRTSPELHVSILALAWALRMTSVTARSWRFRSSFCSCRSSVRRLRRSA